jgi:hypothetical protein
MNNNIEMPIVRTSGNKGLSYLEALSLILVTLKCMGTISCSWIVPFIPVLAPIALYSLVVAIGFLKTKFSKK